MVGYWLGASIRQPASDPPEARPVVGVIARVGVAAIPRIEVLDVGFLRVERMVRIVRLLRVGGLLPGCGRVIGFVTIAQVVWGVTVVLICTVVWIVHGILILGMVSV